MSERYRIALARNLAELQKVLLIRETLLGIEKHKYTANVFVRVINDALNNDYISHAIKVFERSSKSASFWYVYRSDQRVIDQYSRDSGYSIDKLKNISDKLKVVRNGTHFHIDSAGVLDPKKIWSDASLTGKELADAIDFAWGALSAAQRNIGGEIPSLLNYRSDDALAALKRVEGARD